MRHGALQRVAANSLLWSLTLQTFQDNINATAYHFDASQLFVAASQGPNGRWHGFPIRCLLRSTGKSLGIAS